MRFKIHKILGAGTVLLAIVAMVGMASAQSSRTMRIDRNAKVPTQNRQARGTEKNVQQFEPVRLEGEVNLSSRGMHVGRELVRITPATSILPRPRELNRMPDLNRYRGQHVTVFGRRGPDGIEASVVMFRGGGRRAGIRSGQTPADLEYRVPVTSRTGALRDDTPQ